MRSSSPTSRTLAVVVAHPDDDTFGCTGTVALHAQEPGFRFVLIHATSGEAGEIADGSGATRETLGPIREEEDRRSWEVLGRVPDRHSWLHHPDGAVGDLPEGLLADQIAEIFDEERPDVVMTFGPDGVTGHSDHIATGAAASEAFERLRNDGGPGLRRLLYQTIPVSMIERLNEQLAVRGMPIMDPEEPYHPRGVLDDHVDVRIDCAATLDRRVAALAEHRTQAGQGPPPDLLEEFLAWEFHRLAHPRIDEPGRILASAFEGLD